MMIGLIYYKKVGLIFMEHNQVDHISLQKAINQAVYILLIGYIGD